MCVNVHVYGVCLYDLSMHVSVCVFVSVCIYGLYMCVFGGFVCLHVCVCLCVKSKERRETFALCLPQGSANYSPQAKYSLLLIFIWSAN